MHAFASRERHLGTIWDHEAHVSAADRFRPGSLSRKGSGWLHCESCGHVFEVLAVRVWEHRGADGRTHYELRCPIASCSAGIRQWRPASAPGVAHVPSPIERLQRFTGNR